MKYLKNLFSGRINRTQYIIGSIALFVLFILGILGTLLFNSDDSSIFLFMFYLLVFGYSFYSLSLTVRRFHDLGKEGLYVITLGMPIINLFFLIRLLFSSGQKVKNEYGSPVQGDTSLRLIFNPVNEPANIKRNSLFCSRCGLRLDLDSNYCIKCGNKVGG